jgi:hypothetical protein
VPNKLDREAGLEKGGGVGAKKTVSLRSLHPLFLLRVDITIWFRSYAGSPPPQLSLFVKHFWFHAHFIPRGMHLHLSVNHFPKKKHVLDRSKATDVR